ncbi:uncharacterized protein LOC143023983 [Oratosquilla oratoria]|uniref:uncharacterized protein LOC143023983 n=1 Tax=Oratosquilla oratoria TaxID=337810 RepID=UPI003F75828B
MIKLRHFDRERMRVCARKLYVCLQTLFTCCMKGDFQKDHDENAPRTAKNVPDFTKNSKGKTPQDPQGIKRPLGTFEKPKSTVFEDDYTIKCSLGAGAFARTVLVSRKGTGCISVAKIPLEKGSCKSEIRCEIAALSTLNHLNIIKMVDVAKDRGCKIIITEYCPGGTLLAAMERHNKSPCLAWGYQVISYFRQLVSAVSYMHSNQFAHLDLKQDNVVLSADLKVVKVIDFGLSIRTSKVYQREMKSVGGSPWYLAPEVLDKAQRPYAGGMADVWALGCILYELCMDRLPYYEPRIGQLTSKEQMRYYVACCKQGRPALKALKLGNFQKHHERTILKILWCMLDPRPETRSTIWQVEIIKFEENKYEH